MRYRLWFRLLRQLVLLSLPAALLAATPGLARQIQPTPPGPTVVPAPAEPVPSGLTVRSLRIEGLTALAPPVALPTLLPLSPGEPYTAERLAALEAVIQAAFAERGYPYARVEVAATVDQVTGTTDITVQVDPGPTAVFGPIELRVGSPIREADVRERLTFAQGQPFSPSALSATARLLRTLPVAGEVQIQPVGLEAGAPVVPVIVSVSAIQARGFVAEGTLSSATCLQFAGHWRDRYFLGAPRIFSAGLGFSNLLAKTFGGNFPCAGVGDTPYRGVDYSAEVDFRQPWPGDPLSAFGLRLFAGRESFPQTYVREGIGGRAMAIRAFPNELTVTAAYSPVRQRLNAADLYFCGNFGVCDRAGIVELSRSRWLAPLELETFWAPAGRPGILRPPEPSEVRYWLERRPWLPWVQGFVDAAAGVTGSSYQYLRGAGEGALTYRMRRSELAVRSRLGGIAGVGDIIPPEIRFFSGGMQTVRGARQNEVGPRLLLTSADKVTQIGCAPVPMGCPAGLVVDPGAVNVRPTGGDAVVEANLEGRIWIGSRVQLAAFTDFGYIVRRLGLAEPAPFTPPGSEGLLSPGIGARGITRLGPVRIDVAYDTRGARVYPLFTEDPLTGDMIFLGDVVYDPYSWDSPSGAQQFWRRLQLQIAMTQAF